MILTHHRPCQMRGNKADETNRADERDRDRRQDGHHCERSESKGCNMDPEGLCTVVTKPQRSQAPSIVQQDWKSQQKHSCNRTDIGPGGLQKAAE